MLICTTSKWYEFLPEIKSILSSSFKTEIQSAELSIKRFADGEILPVFQNSVRDQNLIIIGSTEQPHDNIFELLLIIDAARRSSVNKITVICPYYSYGRQDRRDGVRCSHGSKLMANMLENVGIDHILTFDIHALQIDGNFNIPFDNITIDNLLGRSIESKIENIKETLNITDNDIVLCSPDAGGVKRVEQINHLLEDKYSIVTILKKRVVANEVSSMQLIGDVKGKYVIICDDILDTGGTLCKATNYLLEEGATHVGAAITHGLLSKDASLKIVDSNLSFLILSSSISNIREKIYSMLEIQRTKDVQVNTQIILANINGVIAKLIYKLANSMSLK